MSNKKQTIIAAASATMLVAGAIPAYAATTVDADATVVAPANQAQASTLVSADAVEGTFTWDQATITPNPIIKKIFSTVSASLCAAQNNFITENPLQWRLAVTGDVDSAYTATIDELAGKQAIQKVMSCTCGGNPADGMATITAGVKGLPIKSLLQLADASQDVNTITFVSSDGTEVAMPLAYVIGHHALLAYEINSEDLSASMGGNNQLWLAGASANYFLRDVVQIRATAEEVVPAAPGEGMDYPNSPNAGITAAK